MTIFAPQPKPGSVETGHRNTFNVGMHETLVVELSNKDHMEQDSKLNH